MTAAAPYPPLVTRQEDDWRRFSSLTTMQNHWDRPDWTPGREAYYWYLTWDSQELRDLADRCQRSLALPYLDPVPLDALHMTLPKIAWSDQIEPDALDRLTNEAARLCAKLEPFTLTVGPLAGSSGAVRFSATPWEPVLELSRHLVNASEGINGVGSAEFCPHVGIAYCNSTVPASPLVAMVQQLRQLPPVDLEVESVDLVRLRREGPTYRWLRVASIPLGS